MFKKQNNLIVLLKEFRDEYQEKIDNYLKDDYLEVQIEALESLRDDYNGLIEVELPYLEEMINRFSFPDHDKKLIYAELRVAQLLLRLNNEKNTSYELSSNHIESLNMFLEGLAEVKEAHKIDLNNRLLEMDRLKSELNNINSLLSKLEDNDNHIYIDDLNILNKVFDLKDVDYDTRKMILVDIIKYNNSLFNSISS